MGRKLKPHKQRVLSEKGNIYYRNPANTQINVNKSTKEELMNMLLEESIQGERVIMNELIEKLIIYYKESKK